MQIEEKPPELASIYGIGLGPHDIVTVDYHEEGLLKRMKGKIEYYYTLEDEKMVVIKNIADPTHIEYLKVKDITMFLEEFNSRNDPRFN